MKLLRHTLIVFLACAGNLATSLAAHAAESVTLQVSAQILAACAFSQKATALNFGDINPTDTADTVKRVTFAFKCNDGTTNMGFSVANNTTGTVQRDMQSSSSTTQKLPYTLTWTPPTAPAQWSGLDGATEVSVELTGTVAAQSARNLAAGSYSDSVTITVTP